MSTRIDYYGDPDAPAANSVRPAASAFVVKNDAVLLIERSDNGNWSMPGGAHESGETLSLSVSEVATGEGDKDPLVVAGDKLYVATAKTFYIYGQVGAPGTYPVDREMNLRKALARSGGLTKLGSENRVKIIRKGQEMKGLDLNAPVQDGDVVVVGEKLF